MKLLLKFSHSQVIQSSIGSTGAVDGGTKGMSGPVGGAGSVSPCVGFWV